MRTRRTTWFSSLDPLRLEISERELLADLDPGWLVDEVGEERDDSADPWVGGTLPAVG